MLTAMRKRPRTMRLAGLIAILLPALAAGMLVPSPVQPALRKLAGLGSSPSQARARIGETQMVDGMALTVHGVTEVSEIPELGALREGQTYLVVDVSIEVVGAESGYCSPSSFQVTDNAGGQYYCTLWAPEPMLRAQTLARGASVRGNVAFDIPSGAENLTLVWETLMRGHIGTSLGR